MFCFVRRHVGTRCLHQETMPSAHTFVMQSCAAVLPNQLAARDKLCGTSLELQGQSILGAGQLHG